MNGVRVTKNVKEIKFDGVCSKLEAKKCFQRQIIYKISETNFNFHWTYCTMGKVQFLFLKSFLVVLIKFSFGRKSGL